MKSKGIDTSQPFVGRRNELSVLDETLDHTIARRGRIVMLAGEPGIGKTRTAQEVASRAESRDVRVLWGRCYEEPGAPPYWPWLQVFREYVRTIDDDALRSLIDVDTAAVVELWPEVSRRIPGVELPSPAPDAAQARFRLFAAIATFWKRSTQRTPILVILDNLHWADAPSLRLLEFLAPDLTGSALMVLGTFRDVEVSRQHPLSATLSELARQPWFQRFTLTRLGEDDTRIFLASALGARVPVELLQEIQVQTEGHPLFMVEMTRYIAQMETIDGQPSDAAALRRVPEGILGTRLNHLSPPCIQLLTSAAVIGRRFSSRLLDAATDDLPEQLRLSAFEEALGARILEEIPEPGWYQFSHALIRETLYDEISAPRRTGLHHRIGQAVEALYAADLTPHLSALVYHYSSALPIGDASRAVELAIRAAEHAEAFLAHEEAARYYRIALQTSEAHCPLEPGRKCSVFMGLGQVQGRAGENLEALQSTRSAFDIAASLGSAREVALAAVACEFLCHKLSLPGETVVGMLQDALRRLRDSDDALKAQVLSALGRSLSFMGRLDEGNRAGVHAIQVARRTGDPAVLAKTLVATLEGYFLQGDEFDTWRSNTDEACRLAAQTNDRFLLLDPLAWRMAHLWESGDLAARADAFRVFMAIAEDTRMPLWTYMGTTSEATLALQQGRFEDCEALARRALDLGRRLPGWDANSGFSVQMFNLFREQGRLKQLAPLVEHFLSTTSKSKTWLPGLMIMHVELEQERQARALFDKLAANDFADLPRDGTWTTSMVFLAETCAYLSDAERAGAIYRFLLPYDGRNIIISFHLACYGPIGRQLGMLCATMRRWNEAQGHFTGAIEMARRQGTPPAVAHTQYEFARMLAIRKHQGDVDKALDLLDEALSISGELGMCALNERARRLRARLAPGGERTGIPGGLSRREVQVLRLISEGKSNQEIAQALYRRPNTVANQVRSILAKINAANRAEATAYAARQGLLNK
jgi:DNA-binding CsgD family transcriptional regulator